MVTGCEAPSTLNNRVSLWLLRWSKLAPRALGEALPPSEPAPLGPVSEVPSRLLPVQMVLEITCWGSRDVNAFKGRGQKPRLAFPGLGRMLAHDRMLGLRALRVA